MYRMYVRQFVKNRAQTSRTAAKLYSDLSNTFCSAMIELMAFDWLCLNISELWTSIFKMEIIFFSHPG